MKYIQPIKRIMITLIGGSFLFLACGYDDDGIQRPESVEGEVSVIITTSDEISLLRELPGRLPLVAPSQANLVITIDDTQTLQTIDGFGGALTGSTAVLLNGNNDAIDMLFGENGIRLSYTRLTVGASDFNGSEAFTYNDIPSGEDLSLDQFSIDRDKADDNPVIPMAMSILNVNSDMKFLASPWTAPAWMKTNNSLNGGSLQTQYFNVYSDYLMRYLNAYKDEGIDIHTITVQNEPLNALDTSPTMFMSATDQADFIGDHFGPKLAASDLTTKIIAYDHNFTVNEDPDYPVTILSDPEASQYTNAIGYHAYGGQPEDIERVTNQFPNAEIYFTEQSGIIGTDGTNFGGEINWFMRNVFMGSLRRGAKTVLLWNLALNENNGPEIGECRVCRGVLKITSGGTIIKNVEYYMLGHFAKYVDPGATVISTENFPGTLENVAFKNPNGSYVLVVQNPSSSTQEISVVLGSESFGYIVPRGALITFKWN